MEIHQVGIIGCGQMGSGIAQVVAFHGHPTIVIEATEDLCQRGIRGVHQRLDKLEQKGSISGDQNVAIKNRLRASTDLSQLSTCDLVIDAIVENREAKLHLWRSLDPILKRDTILASNTSSLSITEMMMATSRPERFLGLHFFNPVPVMTLVEIVRTIATSQEVIQIAADFVGRLGKTPVFTSDRAGFIVNRILIPYLLDSIRILEEGTGTISDIDRAMKLGCGHPMGPFALTDFIGLDTTAAIAEILFEEFREPRFAPPGILKRLVTAGRLGRKSGKGFYDYSDPASPKPMDELVRI